MDHFKGTNETERYNNDLLNETRRTNELLEQIAQLLKTKENNSTQSRNTGSVKK
jgi:hypothetical protein